MTGTSFIPAMIVVLVVARIKKIIQHFKYSGTTSPMTAKTPEELNIRRSLIFNKLVRRNVLVEVTSNHFYLSEEKFEEYRRMRRMRAIAVAIILLLLVLIDVLILYY